MIVIRLDRGAAIPQNGAHALLVLTLLTRTCVAVALSWAAGPGAPVPELAPELELGGARDALRLSDDALEARVAQSLPSLGSLSLGQPNHGKMLGAVKPEQGALLELVAPDFSWGTAETVGYLELAVSKVHAEHPGTPPLHVGHLSRKEGGYLSPHKSHQSGRDVDLGFYYRDGRTWYRRGTAQTLDIARTWSLVRALITETDVEMIIVDYSIQHLLRAHAETIGEDREWLRQIFRGDAQRPRIIRHLRGHATHLHVRFFNPAAQTLARRAYPFLVERSIVAPVTVFHYHRAKKGDTLGRLARIYGTSVRAIQAANGLRSTKIQARKVYKIPRPGGPPRASGTPLEIPPRRLPPEASRVARR